MTAVKAITSASVLDLPRLLFVTPASFNRVTGGGITFSNLFRDWPGDRLATAHNDLVPSSDDICSNYYRLTAREVGVPAALRLLRRAPPQAATATSGTGDGSASPRRRLRRFLLGDALPERGRLSPELEAWIASFRPQLLYTILGGNGMMELVDRIRRRFDLPLVVHFMDDWQSAIYRGALLSPVQRRRMRRLIRGLVDTAQLRLGICDAMCKEYAARFGHPFRAFQNTLDTRRWQDVAKRDLTVGRPIRLLYTGSIFNFAQADSLLACCAAVTALHREGLAITLDIYSPLGQIALLRERLVAEEAVRLHEVISDDERYFRTLAAADILLLPVNFDGYSKRYIRLSMPTKVPSYLVSGTPVLVYGPPGMAQVEYARAAGWGLVVDRQDNAALAGAIRRLAGDEALRRSLSAAARRVAAERHDGETVRAGFQAALAAAARGEG